jgi:hypothetical protein
MASNTSTQINSSDPSVANQIQRETNSLLGRVTRSSATLATAPSVNGSSNTATSVSSTTRSIAPIVSGTEVLYLQSTTSTSRDAVTINSSINNDTGDITTVYSTNGQITVNPVNQTINQYTSVTAGVGQIVAGNGITITSTGAGGTGVVTINSGTSALGNIVSINLDGNAANVLHGDGTWSADQTTYSNSNVVSLMAAFGSNTITTTGNVSVGNIIGNGQALTGIAGANVSGFVPNANVANTAFAVAAANVSGLGNIATVNLSGSTSNVLYGNGVFAAVAASAGIANGTSNVTVPAVNGNVNLVSAGNTTMTVTGTGANITGYANVSGNVTAANLITTGNLTLPNSSILTFGDTPVTNRYYVDATRTDTYTQNGSQSRPFKTIAGAQAAIATAISGGLNPQVEPVYIILLSNITENVSLTVNHVYLIGQNGQIHQPIILTGDITVNPTSGTLNTNHFSITGLEVVGTTNGKAIYVTGTSPLRLSLQDVWLTANGTGAGLYQDNTGTGTYTHGGPIKVSHNGSGDVYCFDIRKGTASFDTVETSGATQVGAAGPGATLTFNNSQLDANGDVVVETYGNGVLVVTNSAIKNSQANGYGIKLNAVANVAGTVSVGQSAFNVPTGTGQAVWLDPNTTVGLSGVFAWAGVSFYPGTNTTINPSIIPAPLTTLVGTIAAPIIVGDITATGTAQDWDLIDNNASALSFDTTGKAGIINLVTTNGAEGVTMSGTLSVTGNANVGNLDTTTATITTGNITTINSGLLQNGNSNITLTANGNVSIQAAGSTVELIVTSTGANITGTANITGNANVGNLGTAQVLASANVTTPQVIANIAQGTAPFLVNSNTVVANLNASLLLGATTATANTANTLALRDASGNLSANFFIGNGSQLTGITVAAGSSIVNGNSNVNIPAANGNVNISAVGTANVIVVTATGINVAGTLNATGNANVGNLGATTAIITTGNITTINSGLLQNGNSNITITANGNISLSAVGSPNEVIITATGVNVAGTLNANGNANVGNLGTAQVLATANITAPQLISNIATGTAPLVVTSTTQVANLSVATAGSATTAGTVTTAAQPNITSVGTLTSLGVTGNISSGNANLGNAATANFFIGSGNNLSNIQGANVTGAVATATTAGTVTTAAQPNITSVGTLTSLTVTGNASAGNLNTAGAVVASTLTSNIATGTAPLTVTSTTRVSNLNVAYANVADNINVAAGTGNNFLIFANAATGNVAELTSTGITANLSANSITATTFIGALANGNSNVNIATANGNVTIAAVGNTTMTVTGTGANITGTLNVTGNITGNTAGFAIGYLNIPQVAAANATLALTDAGKHYYSTSAGNFTLTIPSNASVGFSTGAAISIVVQSAGNVLVNAAAGVTLYMAGNSSAANRVVSNYGMATLLKVATDTWMINGTGVA